MLSPRKAPRERGPASGLPEALAEAAPAPAPEPLPGAALPHGPDNGSRLATNALQLRISADSATIASTAMPNAAKSIALPEALQAFAEERVRAGEYANVDAVAQEAFRLLQQRDERRHQVRDELGALFREMEAGTYIEPSDDEFEQAVHALALRHSPE